MPAAAAAASVADAAAVAVAIDKSLLRAVPANAVLFLVRHKAVAVAVAIGCSCYVLSARIPGPRCCSWFVGRGGGVVVWSFLCCVLRLRVCCVVWVFAGSFFFLTLLSC